MARKSLNCGVCGNLKERFSNYSRCRECARAWSRNYYHTSADRRAKTRRSYVRRGYGIEIEVLERILDSQGSACAICHRHWTACPPAKRTHYERTFLQNLCIDHDHRTGRVRGLLCNACNTALGLLEESAERFGAAIAYLRSHKLRKRVLANMHGDGAQLELLLSDFFGKTSAVRHAAVHGLAIPTSDQSRE